MQPGLAVCGKLRPRRSWQVYVRPVPHDRLDFPKLFLSSMCGHVPMISDELAGFLESGLAITIATRDADREPDGGWAWAARVDRGPPPSHPVRARAQRAVPAQKPRVTSGDRPSRSTFRAAIALARSKGRFESARPGRPEERALIERQVAAFTSDLEVHRIPRALTGGWRCWPAVAIRFPRHRALRADAGPGAGEPCHDPLESLTPCFQGLIPPGSAPAPGMAIPKRGDPESRGLRRLAPCRALVPVLQQEPAQHHREPKALVRIFDPDTLQVYALRLRYVRTETEGPTFESMRLRIEAIASYSGLKGSSS